MAKNGSHSSGLQEKSRETTWSSFWRLRLWLGSLFAAFSWSLARTSRSRLRSLCHGTWQNRIIYQNGENTLFCCFSKLNEVLLSSRGSLALRLRWIRWIGSSSLLNPLQLQPLKSSKSLTIRRVACGCFANLPRCAYHDPFPFETAFKSL